MGAQAVEAARACGYTGAGTVEFIVSGDRPDEFFFMEMNTRLQVEHPVTEMVYGVDLVEQQLRVAAGERLQLDAEPARAARPRRSRSACTPRIPRAGSCPPAASCAACVEPSGAGVRVDSGIATGSSVGSDYDPMLAKVIAWGDDRAEALHRLDHALADTAVLGVTTNIGFLRRLLADPDVQSGALDTGLVERKLEHARRSRRRPMRCWSAAAIAPLERSRAGARAVGAAGRRGGTAARRRLGASSTSPAMGGSRSGCARSRGSAAWSVQLPGGADPLGASKLDADRSTARRRVTIDGRVFHVARLERRHDDVRAHRWRELDDQRGRAARRRWRGARRTAVAPLRSPMPGTVIAVPVALGDAVTSGQAVAIVEAMKMEHTLTAPFDGAVVDVHVAAGCLRRVGSAARR